MRGRAAFLLILLLGAASLSCEAGRQEPLDVGADVGFPREGVLTVSILDATTGVVASAKGVVVIDTGRSPSLGRAARRSIEAALGRDDFIHVVNTHWHSDHTGGNQAWPEAAIIGHESAVEGVLNGPADAPGRVAAQEDLIRELREKTSTLDPSSEERREAELRLYANEMLLRDLEGGYIPTPPGRTLTERLVLDLGGVTLLLIHAGRSHTESDLLVVVPERRVVFTGDLICSPESFCFRIDAMADVATLESALGEVLAHPARIDLALTGHGEVLGREHLVALHRQLQEAVAAQGTEPSAAGALDVEMRERGVAAGIASFRRRLDEGEEPGLFLEEEFDILGRRLLARGRTRDALAVFTIASERLPDSALLHDDLGAAHLGAGQVDLAVEAYQRSLELNPWNRNAEWVLRELRQRPR